MHNRSVLILRFPSLADDTRRGPVGVCEDPGTGEQRAFTTADELWALVQAQIGADKPPRTTSPALRFVVRIPRSKPEEDS